jgi:hypothetical protein
MPAVHSSSSTVWDPTSISQQQLPVPNDVCQQLPLSRFTFDSIALSACSVSVVLHAALTVYVGSWRSIKAEPPQESMTHKDAMKFPIVSPASLTRHATVLTVKLASSSAPSHVMSSAAAAKWRSLACRHINVCLLCCGQSSRL